MTKAQTKPPPATLQKGLHLAVSSHCSLRPRGRENLLSEPRRRRVPAGWIAMQGATLATDSHHHPNHLVPSQHILDGTAPAKAKATATATATTATTNRQHPYARTAHLPHASPIRPPLPPSAHCPASRTTSAGMPCAPNRPMPLNRCPSTAIRHGEPAMCRWSPPASGSDYRPGSVPDLKRSMADALGPEGSDRDRILR
jgi:hypothetical protein